ncbi:unnamed protein product [Urochloa humidicola]
METAVLHRAKKKRLEALESPDPGETSAILSPAALDATDPNPPGAGGEEEGAVDYISPLPDAILGEVISLLPIKDAARTQTLASRWRHIWRSAPLNLDCDELLTGGGSLTGLVSRILSAHMGPGRRFRVPALVLVLQATVDAWLQSPALDNLKEIDFWVRSYGSVMLEPPPAPASTFRFAPCLGVATLSQCHLSDDIVQAVRFPQLKKLALQRVRISEDSLHSLIAGCPVLECLLLNKSFGFRCVRINSASLKSIGLIAQHYEKVTNLVEFIIEDAPCLERFLYHEQWTGLQVSVITAPKLETLGPLCDLDTDSRLAFGSMIIQPSFMRLHIHGINSTTPLWSVKNLAVNLLSLSLDVTIDLMRCFPFLEKLYIQSFQGGDNNLWRRKHRNLVRCLDIRLKTIVLNNYRGFKSQVNFATFFVLNAKMLESMTFQGGCYNDEKWFLADQHRLLQFYI